MKRHLLLGLLVIVVLWLIVPVFAIPSPAEAQDAASESFKYVKRTTEFEPPRVSLP